MRTTSALAFTDGRATPHPNYGSTVRDHDLAPRLDLFDIAPRSSCFSSPVGGKLSPVVHVHLPPSVVPFDMYDGVRKHVYDASSDGWSH